MNRHGFTLVEVIVSAVILAAAVGCLLYVFSTESGVVARTGRRMQAMDFARQTLEELKNAVDAQTWPNTGDLVGVGVTAILPDSELKDKFSGTRHYTVTDIDVDGDNNVDYKKVTVTIGWTEPQ